MQQINNPETELSNNGLKSPAYSRLFRRGVQALTDFLVADACFFCGGNARGRRWRGEVGGLRPAPPVRRLSGTAVVYLFRIFPVINRPICPPCARKFETARSPALIGWYGPSGRVTTLRGDVFEGAAARRLETPPRTRLRVVAPFRINDMSLKLIHLIKFSGRRSLIQPVARAVAATLADHLGALRRDSVLVPVPMDPASQRRRGFNQAEMLAFALSRRAGLPVAPYALKKTRSTAPQSMTERRLRAGNVRGVFRAGGRSIRGRRVLLVDDLVTTGATAASCASTLVGAGARSVTVVCLASAL